MDAGAEARDSVDGLIRAARQGSAEARERLLALYRNYLRLLAESSFDKGLRGKADASDVVQEAMLKASERFPQFRGATEGKLVAWLKSILARGLADLNRRFRANAARGVGRERSLEVLLDCSSKAMERLPVAPGTSPSRRAQRRETAVLVADALAALPPDDREVIVLRSLRDLDWDEVGRSMGRSAEAVRALWGRAFRRLGALAKERGWRAG